MEEFNDERDGLPQEKGKRKLKTPAQIQALEKFYREHMYPSESMKLQFAEQYGLSEKQVSGWFCHRRSKDKKLLRDESYANRIENTSAGAALENSGVLRQESCNSTIQVERQFDCREVESNSFHNWKFAATIAEHMAPPVHIESYGVVDERSSGSSTTSYERLLKQGVENCTREPRCSLQDENDMTGPKGANERVYTTDTMSSYLSTFIESPPVSLVKMKLGRQYRDDGPPLACDFDPLPPGAFEAPVRDSISEPYYVGDSIKPRTCGSHVIVAEEKVYDKYRSGKILSDSHLEGSGCNKKLQKITDHSNFTGWTYNPRASGVKKNEHTPRKIFAMEEDEDFADSSDDYRYNNMDSSNYGFSGVSVKNFNDHSHLTGAGTYVKKPILYPAPDRRFSSPLSQRELFGSKTSNLTVMGRRTEYPHKDHIQPRGTLKVLKKKILKPNIFRKNCYPASPEMMMTSDKQMRAHEKGFEGKLWDDKSRYSYT